MTTQSACVNCRNFRAGECRRNPPVRLPRKFATDAEVGNRVRDETLIWGWPKVKDDDWCAEWRGWE